MRLLVALELVTSGLSAYLTFLAWRAPAHSSLRIIQFAVALAGGIVLAAAAWRRERWVPKAALILAAWVGIPNLVSVSAFSRIIAGSTPNAVGVPVGLLALVAVCQLAAFVIAICLLEFRDAAV
jgi:hypothetical protein